MLKLIAPILLIIVLLALQLLSLSPLLMNDHPFTAWMLIIQAVVFLIQAARAYLFARRCPDLNIGDRQTASSTLDDDDTPLGVGA